MVMTIGRRKFIALLGGAATWPVVAHAKQSAVPVVGSLHLGEPDDVCPAVTQPWPLMRARLAPHCGGTLIDRPTRGRRTRAELPAGLVRRGSIPCAALNSRLSPDLPQR